MRHLFDLGGPGPLLRQTLCDLRPFRKPKGVGKRARRRVLRRGAFELELLEPRILMAANALIGVDFDDIGGTEPANWNLVTGLANQTVTSLIDEDNDPRSEELIIDDVGGVMAFDAASPPGSLIPIYTNLLAPIDGAFVNDTGLSFTWDKLNPGDLYDVYIFGSSTTGETQDVSVTGLNLPVTFQQNFSTNGLFINDELGSSSQALTESVVTVAVDNTGQINIDVTQGAGGSGVGIAGLAIGKSDFAAAEISGITFRDVDTDGVFDPADGEVGLGGWIIFLDDNSNGKLDAGELSTTTDVDGTYTFSGLAPGDYDVWEVLPVGWRQSTPGTPLVPAGHLLTLASGEVSTDNDFGNFQLAGIVGTKWEDLNGNGVQDGAELGQAGWIIFLDDNGDGILQNDFDIPDDIEEGEERFKITDPSGNYEFIDLDPGDYVVVEVQKARWVQRFPAFPFFPEPAILAVHEVTLEEGSTLVQDFGNQWFALVGVDFDGPGGLSPNNWTRVTNAADHTDLDLINERGDVTQIDLRVESDLGVLGIDQTTSALGAETIPQYLTNPLDELGGNFFHDFGATFTWEGLVPGQLYDVFVFGSDSFGDSQTVEIRGGGTPIAFEQTFGRHQLFVNTELGDETRLLDDFVATASADEDGEIEIRIEVAPGAEFIGVAGLAIGETHLPVALISGVKYQDNDGNGTYDDSFDIALPGWTVFLDDNDNGLLDDGEPFTITAADRTFLDLDFDAGLPSGAVIDGDVTVVDDSGNQVLQLSEGLLPDTALTLSVDVPETIGMVTLDLDYRFTDLGDGDTFYVVVSGFPFPVFSQVGTDFVGSDFVAMPQISIFRGQTVEIELHLVSAVAPNAQVQVDNVLIKTQEDGRYQFPPLVPGQTYNVREVLEDGWQQDQPGVPGAPDKYVIALPFPDPVTQVITFHATDVNFGNFIPGSISGRKFNDLDGDGVFEPQNGELGMAGWEIFLDGTDQSTITDADGFYTFENLISGQYVVRENLRDGWNLTTPTNNQHVVQLDSDDNPSDLDFGNQLVAAPSPLVGVDFDIGGSNSPFNWTTVSDPSDHLEADLIDESGAVTAIDLRLDSIDGDLGIDQTTDPLNSVVPQHFNPLNPIGGNFFHDTSATFIWEDLQTDSLYEVFVFALDTFTSLQNVTISGGGVPIAFAQDFTDPGSDELLVNSEFGDSTRQLDEYAVVISADADGRITVRVDTAQGTEFFGIAGLAIRASDLQPVMIQGTKYEDLDGDGERDLGEPGLAGWTIFLDTDGDGELDDDEISTVTDATGNYAFDNLTAGDYTIAEVLQDDWFQSQPGTLDLPAPYAVTLAVGEVSDNNDFGNFQFSQISGAKWHDINGDGVRDLDEPGLEGWTIFLDSTTISTTTDSDGNYSFNGLVPGDYIVREQLQTDWVQTFPANGQHVVTLTSSDDIADLDFGNHFVISGQISGVKFNDLNGNGQQDTDEPVLEGWTIFLDENGNLQFDAGEDFRVTGADGTYAFTELVEGEYTVVEVQQDGWQSTTPDDSVFHIDLALNEKILNADFGNAEESASISGIKFNDVNGNGQQDAGEPGLEGWTIFIDKNLNELLDAGEPFTVTDENSAYKFDNLIPGTYFLAEILQAGWQQTFPGDGGSSNSLDITEAFDVPASWTVILQANQDATGIDFGNTLIEPMTISGFKFEDRNADGTVGANERGLEGWQIYLDANDNGVLDNSERLAVTDTAGHYSFASLQPGEHVVREVLQDGWFQSLPDPDDPVAQGAQRVTLVLGDSLTNINFGNYQFGSISGTVYEDTNGDGVINTGEPMIPNATVFLDIDGIQGRSAGDIETTTGPVGSYLFGQDKLLIPGSYTVGVVNPDTNIYGGQIAPIGGVHTAVVTSRGVAGNNNFGFFKFANITGLKWNDTNADGVRDASEPILNDWTIYLDINNNNQRDDDEPVNVTGPAGGNPSGIFDFASSKLEPSTYTVREEVQEGWAQSFPLSGELSVTLISGEVAEGKEFGNFQLSSIAGIKWDDLNGNGTREPGEPGIEGWTIFLDDDGDGELDNGEIFVTTVGDDPNTPADETGTYIFDALGLGEYRVTEQLQDDFDQSAPGDAAAGVHMVSLTTNQHITGIDFGNFKFGRISGIKFEDINGNQVRDTGEPVLPGWRIFLDTNGNGTLDSGERSEVTDASGAYAFDEVEPGEYTVAEMLNAGWGQSLPGEVAGMAHLVTMTSGFGVAGINFGNFRFGSISGTKWEDLNANGEFDSIQSGDSTIGQIDLAPLGLVILTRNDDQSTGLIDFGFTFEFFGSNFDQLYINNNGNITFTDALFDFTPDGFPQDLPIVAPFSADVDTRNQLSAQVHLARGVSTRGNKFVQIDWPGVGYFSQNTDLLNDFTLYIEDDPDGDIVAFFYRDMQWTTGDADGDDGFGGQGAQIGFDSGDGENFISLSRPATSQQLAQFANSSFTFRIDPFGVPQLEKGLEGWQIYLDTNENNQRDVGEQGTQTDADGNYSFTQLAPDEYRVAEVLEPGWYQSLPNTGIHPVDETLPLVVTLLSDEDVTDQNFGNFRLGSIAGSKWDDVNGNGQRDDGEPGLEGWTIFTDLNDSGQFDAGEPFDVTDAAGNYAITNLLPDTYTVAEVIPDPWVQSFPVTSTGLDTHTVEVAVGQDILDIDFGNLKAATVAGIKFEDFNGNGQLDGDEPVLAEWTIFADTNSNGILDDGELSTLTEANGTYLLAGLAPGQVVVTEVIPDGWGQSLPAGPASGYELTVVSGDTFDDRDFGNFRFGSIAGLKWDDLDGDGVLDANEPLLEGWTIFVDSNGNDVFDDGELFDVTDTGGAYLIEGAAAGEHLVDEVLQDNFYQSFPLTGDHPVDETAAHTVNVISDGAVTDINFGNFKLGSISGTASGPFDPDGNGPLAVGFEGVPDFVVFLDLDGDGQRDPNEPFTFTDENGNYTFEDLLPGDYEVLLAPRPQWITGGPRIVDLDRGQDVDNIDFFSTPTGPDITGAIIALTLSGTITPGDSGKITLEISNVGPGAVDHIVVIDLLFSQDDKLDDFDPLALRMTGQRIKLADGQSKTIKAKFTVPGGLDKGDVTVLAVIDATGEIDEARTDNNVVASDVTHHFGWFFGNFAGRRNVKLTVMDPNDVPVTFALSRAGMGEIFGREDFDQVVLTGTTDKSKLKITTSSRGSQTNMGHLLVNGSLNSAAMKTTNVQGDMIFEGSLRKAQLRDYTGPGELTVGRWDGKSSVKLQMRQVHDLTINSVAPLAMLDAEHVVDTDGIADMIQTPWIKKLYIDQDFANSVILTSTAAKRSINKAKVGGWFTDLTVWAPNPIGTLQFGGMRNANIYNGVRQGFDTADGSILPDSADDFIQDQSIIKKLRVDGIEGEEFAMINSNVASWVLKKVQVGRVQTNNPMIHGLAAHEIGSYMRQREGSFSPRSTNLSGPVLVDVADTFVTRLV